MVARLFRRSVLALALVGTLSACSSVQETVTGWFSKDRNKDGLPAELVELKSATELSVRWHESVGEAGLGVLQPALTEDALYAANVAGGLYRLDRRSGKVIWHLDTGLVQTGGVGAGGGLVLVGGEKGELAAYGEDGRLRWKVKVSSEVLSVPQVAGDLVVVRAGDGRIVGLNAADGKPRWNYQRPTPALIVRSHAGVAIQRGSVFAGFAGGKLVSLDLATGSLNWEAVVSQPRGNTELERISDITSSPVLDDEQVCAISFQGHLACFDLEQGSLLWSRDISSDKGLMLLRKYLYLSDSHGAVMALDKTSGATLWKNEQLFRRRISVPVALGNYLAVGDLEGYLHLLNREDGSLAGRIATDGSPVDAIPQALDNGVLLQTHGGGLYSLGLH